MSAGNQLEPGKIRDVNTPMLAALLQDAGAVAITHEVVLDQRDLLRTAIQNMLAETDMLLVSVAPQWASMIIWRGPHRELGRSLCTVSQLSPVNRPSLVKLKANQSLAYWQPSGSFLYVPSLVKPLLYSFSNSQVDQHPVEAILSRAVSSNHGREEVILVRLEGDQATPVPSKSGLFYCFQGKWLFPDPRDRKVWHPVKSLCTPIVRSHGI